MREIQKEIKGYFPENHFWTIHQDVRGTKKPREYEIEKVRFESLERGFIVSLKYHYKSYKNQPNVRTIKMFLGEFFGATFYLSKKHAWFAYFNRPCPKCGNSMGDSEKDWCNECMEDRAKREVDFNKNHMFYHKKHKTIYLVRYTDELTRNKGFDGKHFTIRRLDTGEILETNNLWDMGKNKKNTNNVR